MPGLSRRTGAIQQPETLPPRVVQGSQRFCMATSGSRVFCLLGWPTHSASSRIARVRCGKSVRKNRVGRSCQGFQTDESGETLCGNFPREILVERRTLRILFRQSSVCPNNRYVSDTSESQGKLEILKADLDSRICLENLQAALGALSSLP